MTRSAAISHARIFPRKAFVLAAGLGSRLRPLTTHQPKPMLPLWGKPMIAHTLEMLQRWGVEEVLLNLHHAPGPLVEYLAGHPMPGLRVSCLWEPELLGTGGALRQAVGFLQQEPFWLVNADVFARPSPEPLRRAWATGRFLAVCWLTESAGPKTVRCEHGLIRDFNDPHGGHATFCGLQLLSPRILRYLRPSGPDSIIDAYRRAQAHGEHIAGVMEPDAFWADMGTPSQYLQAHRDTAAMLGHGHETFPLPAAALFSAAELRAMQKALRAPSAKASPTPPSAAELSVEVLPPRGSSREFYRLHLPPPHPPIMAIRWSPDRDDNALYARHTRFLARLGIPVPRLFLDAPSKHLLLMEDLGAETLETRMARSAPTRLRLTSYRQVLNLLLPLHIKGLAAARRTRLSLMPPYGPETCAWEHDYFLTAFARRHAHWTLPQCRRVTRALTHAAELLLQSPQGLIHRDLQSSNILFRAGAPVLIDYQGMRAGPVAYDLASLLCDPYTRLTDLEQQTLLHHYIRRHPQGPALAAAFPAAACQRLAQALGAFATLSLRPGMERFADYIPPALARLQFLLPAFL